MSTSKSGSPSKLSFVNGEGYFKDVKWDDMRFPVVGRNLDTTSGRIDYNYTELGVDFADNARFAETEQISIICQLQHDYELGTDVDPHIHWLQSSADMPNWLLQYRVYNNGETPGAWQTVKWLDNKFTYTSGTILQITDFPDIDMSSIDGVSSFIDFKLFRDTLNTSTLFDGADPLTGTALLKEFDIHYRRDASGSTMEYLK